MIEKIGDTQLKNIVSQIAKRHYKNSVFEGIYTDIENSDESIHIIICNIKTKPDNQRYTDCYVLTDYEITASRYQISGEDREKYFDLLNEAFVKKEKLSIA